MSLFSKFWISTVYFPPFNRPKNTTKNRKTPFWICFKNRKFGFRPLSLLQNPFKPIFPYSFLFLSRFISLQTPVQIRLPRQWKSRKCHAAMACKGELFRRTKGVEIEIPFLVFESWTPFFFKLHRPFPALKWIFKKNEPKKKRVKKIIVFNFFKPLFPPTAEKFQNSNFHSH